MRPSAKRQAKLAGIPCALIEAAAAFDGLSPRAAPSARWRQAHVDRHACVTRDRQANKHCDIGPLTDRQREHLGKSLGTLSSGVTRPVSFRPSTKGLPPSAHTLHASLERLKEIERLDAYANALAHALDAEKGFPMHIVGPVAAMEIIEAYVDAVRKAQGKRTYSELDPDDRHFEAHLDDFVADIFRAMGASPRG